MSESIYLKANISSDSTNTKSVIGIITRLDELKTKIESTCDSLKYEAFDLAMDEESLSNLPAATQGKRRLLNSAINSFLFSVSGFIIGNTFGSPCLEKPILNALTEAEETYGESDYLIIIKKIDNLLTALREVNTIYDFDSEELTGNDYNIVNNTTYKSSRLNNALELAAQDDIISFGTTIEPSAPLSFLSIDEAMNYNEYAETAESNTISSPIVPINLPTEGLEMSEEDEPASFTSLLGELPDTIIDANTLEFLNGLNTDCSLYTFITGISLDNIEKIEYQEDNHLIVVTLKDGTILEYNVKGEFLSITTNNINDYLDYIKGVIPNLNELLFQDALNSAYRISLLGNDYKVTYIHEDNTESYVQYDNTNRIIGLSLLSSEFALLGLSEVLGIKVPDNITKIEITKAGESGDSELKVTMINNSSISSTMYITDNQTFNFQEGSLAGLTMSSSDYYNLESILSDTREKIYSLIESIGGSNVAKFELSSKKDSVSIELSNGTIINYNLEKNEIEIQPSGSMDDEMISTILTNGKLWNKPQTLNNDMFIESSYTYRKIVINEEGYTIYYSNEPDFNKNTASITFDTSGSIIEITNLNTEMFNQISINNENTFTIPDNTDTVSLKIIDEGKTYHIVYHLKDGNTVEEDVSIVQSTTDNQENSLPAIVDETLVPPNENLKPEETTEESTEEQQPPEDNLIPSTEETEEQTQTTETTDDTTVTGDSTSTETTQTEDTSSTDDSTSSETTQTEDTSSTDDSTSSETTQTEDTSSTDDSTSSETTQTEESSDNNTDNNSDTNTNDNTDTNTGDNTDTNTGDNTDTNTGDNTDTNTTDNTNDNTNDNTSDNTSDNNTNEEEQQTEDEDVLTEEERARQEEEERALDEEIARKLAENRAEKEAADRKAAEEKAAEEEAARQAAEEKAAEEERARQEAEAKAAEEEAARQAEEEKAAEEERARQAAEAEAAEKERIAAEEKAAEEAAAAKAEEEERIYQEAMARENSRPTGYEEEGFKEIHVEGFENKEISNQTSESDNQVPSENNNIEETPTPEPVQETPVVEEKPTVEEEIPEIEEEEVPDTDYENPVVVDDPKNPSIPETDTISDTPTPEITSIKEFGKKAGKISSNNTYNTNNIINPYSNTYSGKEKIEIKDVGKNASKISYSTFNLTEDEKSKLKAYSKSQSGIIGVAAASSMAAGATKTVKKEKSKEKVNNSLINLSNTQGSEEVESKTKKSSIYKTVRNAFAVILIPAVILLKVFDKIDIIWLMLLLFIILLIILVLNSLYKDELEEEKQK